MPYLCEYCEVGVGRGGKEIKGDNEKKCSRCSISRDKMHYYTDSDIDKLYDEDTGHPWIGPL